MPKHSSPVQLESRRFVCWIPLNNNYVTFVSVDTRIRSAECVVVLLVAGYQKDVGTSRMDGFESHVFIRGQSSRTERSVDQF